MLRSTGKLQDNLALILEMPDMCDVTFLVGRKQVPIYGVKAILATRSRYLYQLILQQQKQVELDNPSKKRSKKSKPSPIQHKLCIKVPDYQVEDFRAFLRFVHSGKVEIDSSNVIAIQYNQLKFSKRREVSVTAHPWDPEEDWRHRWRTSTAGLSG
ncbi:serine-enriched protein-like [Haliotis rufescens]|uniref:serine-enriched protein-like n=1 Tax=Haliotis rufescens TaxID=6454 RepID=UPI00201FAEBC|nr:serine-enriched protein-like [Haliotis rufescens]